MRKISPFLWFDTQAEEAAKYYVSIFKNSKITNVTHYGEAGPGPAGSVMTVAFELDGQEFTALNGGPQFTFTPAVSFVVNCKTQDEVDYYWDRFTADGEEVQCGWVTDKFGLSWQIVPDGISDLIAGDDEEGSRRAMEAMFTMKKLDIDVLRRAYNGDTISAKEKPQWQILSCTSSSTRKTSTRPKIFTVSSLAGSLTTCRWVR
jgi:predicted 3-demethylubiquinone-9 3-methyltransferase (glyoxalase superfamily)